MVSSRGGAGQSLLLRTAEERSSGHIVSPIAVVPIGSTAPAVVAVEIECILRAEESIHDPGVEGEVIPSGCEDHRQSTSEALFDRLSQPPPVEPRLMKAYTGYATAR